MMKRVKIRTSVGSTVKFFLVEWSESRRGE